MVENVCVYGESIKYTCIALVVADRNKLTTLGEKLGKGGKSYEDLCEDKDVEAAVLKQVVAHGKKAGLEKFEIPATITLCQVRRRRMIFNLQYSLRFVYSSLVVNGYSNFKIELKLKQNIFQAQMFAIILIICVTSNFTVQKIIYYFLLEWLEQSCTKFNIL